MTRPIGYPMPWTFAHPAAVLPLRRFCPWPLNFAALAIGALTPDFGYYIEVAGLAVYAHMFTYSVLVCLPTGWLLLACFYLGRKPVWFLLPQPHRGLLEPLTHRPAPLGAAALLSATASIIAGAWSHIAWDSFTHRTGLMVARISLLQERVPGFGASDVRVYHVLQHLSTAAGIVLLVSAYRFYARREGVRPLFKYEREDKWRYVLFATILLTSLAIAAPLSVIAATKPAGDLALRSLVFLIAIKGVSLFLALVVAAAVVSHLARRRFDRDAQSRANLTRST